MKPPQADGTILRRMGLEARPYWPHILGIFLLSLLSTPLTLLTPLPFKIVVDSVIGSYFNSAGADARMKGVWTGEDVKDSFGSWSTRTSGPRTVS